MLLDIRMRLAKDNGTAPYAICGDETIVKIAKIRPSTRARLANIDGVNQHLVSMYGDSFLQSITQASKELNLPLDGEVPEVQTASTRKAYGTSERQLTPAKLNALKLWQKGFSIQNVATQSGVKERTIISYILEAARDGHEVKWARFCSEIGLTSTVASQIRSAITKVGSRDRLKPIKEELPDSVSYECIKTFLQMEDNNVSAEAIDGVPIDINSPSCTKGERNESSNWRSFTKNRAASQSKSNGSELDTAPVISSSSQSFAGTKQPRSDDPFLDENSSKKLHKADDQEHNCSNGLEATESAMLEWIADHDEVSLSQITDHFRGSKKELITDLLDTLEGNYVIFKKKDMYRAL